jgi:hypothetical protein
MIKRGCPYFWGSLLLKLLAMKKMLLCLPLLLSAAFIPAITRAQFLKTLVDNAKNTIAGKNTSSTTGKKDSTANAGTTIDTNALKQRLAQLQKANAGPSVSPADSAAAIQGFKSATGGSGLYYQYLDVYDMPRGKKDSIFKDTMSIAITDGHNARTDFSLLGDRTEVLGHAGMPRYSMMIYTRTKTYQLHIIDTAAINRPDGMTYQVTKVGNEQVQGYNCIHARVAMSTPGSKTPIMEDYWLSADVPGYATFKQMMVGQHVTPQIMKALEAAGCSGFFVKVTVHSAAYSLDMQLIQATRKDFPASYFELPSGYTPATNVNTFNRTFQK